MWTENNIYAIIVPEDGYKDECYNFRPVIIFAVFMSDSWSAIRPISQSDSHTKPKLLPSNNRNPNGYALLKNNLKTFLYRRDIT